MSAINLKLNIAVIHLFYTIKKERSFREHNLARHAMVSNITIGKDSFSGVLNSINRNDLIGFFIIAIYHKVIAWHNFFHRLVHYLTNSFHFKAGVNRVHSFM